MKFIDFKKITCFFSWRKLKERKHDPAGDWKIICAFFVFFISLVVLINAYIFWKYYNRQNDANDVKEIEAVSVNEAEFNDVLKKIKESKERYNERVAIPPEINDPSL